MTFKKLRCMISKSSIWTIDSGSAISALDAFSSTKKGQRGLCCWQSWCFFAHQQLLFPNPIWVFFVLLGGSKENSLVQLPALSFKGSPTTTTLTSVENWVQFEAAEIWLPDACLRQNLRIHQNDFCSFSFEGQNFDFLPIFCGKIAPSGGSDSTGRELTQPDSIYLKRGSGRANACIYCTGPTSFRADRCTLASRKIFWSNTGPRKC